MELRWLFQKATLPVWVVMPVIVSVVMSVIVLGNWYGASGLGNVTPHMLKLYGCVRNVELVCQYGIYPP